MNAAVPAADVDDRRPRRPVVWSIAGTDSGGGAGLAADVRAAEACGVHLATVVAAVTAQHSRAVRRVAPVDPDLLDAQLAALAEDLPPAVVKTGLLGGAAQIAVVARWIDRLRLDAPVALVVDPVLGASSGAGFVDEPALQAYRALLVPRATVLTPNRREARRLLGLADDQAGPGSHAGPAPARASDAPACKQPTPPGPAARAWPCVDLVGASGRGDGLGALALARGGDMAMSALARGGDVATPALARGLRALGGASVLITGGDLEAEDEAPPGGHGLALDWLACEHAEGWLAAPRRATRHTHGTGCSFATSLAAALAHGFVVADAAVLAKMATLGALDHADRAGQGPGPVRPRAGFAGDPALMPWMSFGATAPGAVFGATRPRPDTDTDTEAHASLDTRSSSHRGTAAKAGMDAGTGPASGHVTGSGTDAGLDTDARSLARGPASGHASARCNLRSGAATAFPVAAAASATPASSAVSGPSAPSAPSAASAASASADSAAALATSAASARSAAWKASAGSAASAAPIGLYALVDSTRKLAHALEAGVRTVQLRLKAPPDADEAWRRALHRDVKEAVRQCRAAGARLFVNDHWAVAAALGAHGVHLGQEDLMALGEGGRRALAASGLALGVSSHSLWELARARGLDLAYVACGPVWPTTTKAMPWRPQGLPNLAWWARMAGRPVVAIGGVLNPAQAEVAARQGADGVVLVRALGDDARATVAPFAAAWARGRAAWERGGADARARAGSSASANAAMVASSGSGSGSGIGAGAADPGVSLSLDAGHGQGVLGDDWPRPSLPGPVQQGRADRGAAG